MLDVDDERTAVLVDQAARTVVALDGFAEPDFLESGSPPVFHVGVVKVRTDEPKMQVRVALVIVAKLPFVRAVPMQMLVETQLLIADPLIEALQEMGPRLMDDFDTVRDGVLGRVRDGQRDEAIIPAPALAVVTQKSEPLATVLSDAHRRADFG